MIGANSVARIITQTADLVEAEGRLLRVHVYRLLTAVLAMLLAACIGMAGLGLLVLALFLALESVLGPAGASAICGVVCLAITGGLAWLATRMKH